jgi:hypothetical protein
LYAFPTIFGYAAEHFNGLNLAYLHIIEPRIKGNAEIAAVLDPVASNCSNNQITMHAGINARTKKDGFRYHRKNYLIL